jgi:hypothetical protein
MPHSPEVYHLLEAVKHVKKGLLPEVKKTPEIESDNEAEFEPGQEKEPSQSAH